MKIKQVLLYFVFIIFLLGIISFIFPAEGIRISKDFILYFPNIKELISVSDNSSKVDIDSLINSQIIINNSENGESNKLALHLDNSKCTVSCANINSSSKSEIEIKKIKEEIKTKNVKKETITPLEFPQNMSNVLDNFFSKLEKFDASDRIRIMHYGDSQIEGDRITSGFRNKLQTQFGGVGIGLCMPVSIYSQISIAQKNSSNWKRYPGFVKPDASVKHKKYGPMIAFNRYAPLAEPAWKRPESMYYAWLEFNKANDVYSNTSTFKNVVIYYGNSKEKVKITVKNNNDIVAVDTLKNEDGLHVYKYSSPEYIDNIRLEFQGFDSPDFYAISLEDDYGIFVDNIGLRGSSGCEFSTNDAALLSDSYNHLNVDLFILQFGGNIVPYKKNEKDIKQYADYFKYHIQFLKKLVPDVCVIVIGPSDMSTKDGELFVTYPNLESIINELRKAVHEAEAVFWDTYSAMGGKNSMPDWVKKGLASQDHIHFTNSGADLASNMFYNSLIYEYKLFLERNGNAN